MKLLDKAAKLEKAVLGRLVRRTDVARHPLELYHAILDDIEDASEPGARDACVFPYNRLTVLLPTRDERYRATAEAIFAEPPSIEERVRQRLRERGCRDAHAVAVDVKFVDGKSEEWAGRDYRIDFRRQTTARAATRERKGQRPHELSLVVVAGTASRARYATAESRVNLGRLAEIADHEQRLVRRNQVAFVEDDDAVNQSVSRAHAHVSFDRGSGEARVHDDGSTRGTRVVRGGRTLDVPRGGRGLRLHDGDEILLGEARLRVALRVARR